MDFLTKRFYPENHQGPQEETMESTMTQQIRQLYEVERLSHRQIAQKLMISRKKVRRIIRGQSLKKPPRKLLIQPYERLIREWYQEHPFLKAIQIHDRLKSYGFPGGYDTVKLYTRSFRKRKSGQFHELEFLLGEEAQVDWMEYRFPFGILYGFVLILAYSRYLFAQFYPRHSLEFFLDGHISAFQEINGIAHRHRYDNLKSVILKRTPEITFNPQFLDFARHYAFSIHPCTPGRANEKGRVERVIRDIKDFLNITPCRDIYEANRKIYLWRGEKNQRIHRSTGLKPIDLLKNEKLKTLPRISYQPYRVVLSQISKTGWVEFDTNRYSTPSSLSGQPCEIFAYPDRLEIWVHRKKIAAHSRSFERHQKIENPAHREKLLNRTPHFKTQRIFQLLNQMDPCVTHFLREAQEDGQDPLTVASDLFPLLVQNSKARFLSAIREANHLKTFKLKYVQSLLQSPRCQPDPLIQPQDSKLLTITYTRRSLHDYDQLV